MNQTQGDAGSPLAIIGFEFDQLSAHKVSGRFLVTSLLCQEFGKLHGGVSAMIAEALASYGAIIASGYNRVAGMSLSINHHKSADVGDLILAEATPLGLGKSIQVWSVRFSKIDSSNSGIETLISTSSVTVFCNYPETESDKDAAQRLKGYAKL